MDVRINVNEKAKSEDVPDQQSQKSEIKVLYYDISEFSQYQQILICSVGVFVFYLMYGYLQVTKYTHI